MKITVNYANSENTLVRYISENDYIFISKGSHCWGKYKIDELEKNGEILPFIEPEIIEKSEAEKRNEMMESELTWTMIQRQYHETSDEKRMIYALDDLNRYAIQCRDHVVHDENGGLVIVGEIPKRPEPIK